MACFSSSVISANVRPSPSSGTNSGVVAEASIAPFGLGDRAGAHPFDGQLLAVGPHDHGHGAEPRPAVGAGRPSTTAAAARLSASVASSPANRPVRTPGAPPSASTSSPVSSAPPADRSAARDGGRLESGVALQRVGVLDDVGHVGRSRQQLDDVAEDGLRSRPPCRGWPTRTRASAAPLDRAAGGGTATISACRSAICPSPPSASAEQLIELAARERHALGGSLHLDEAGVAAAGRAQHHDVHVDLGRAVLDVRQVEHGHAADDADADRRAEASAAGWPASRPAATTATSASCRAMKPPQMLAVRVPPSACSTSQSTTTWRSPSAFMSHARPQAAADQALDLDGAPALLALGRLAVDALGRRTGQHRVLGRHPALARAAHPARHVLVDGGGAQHPGAAERHEARAVGHLGEVAFERDRVAARRQRVRRGGASVCPFGSQSVGRDGQGCGRG